MQMTNKLKIAIIGYGKMGQMIEQKAIERGHDIVVKIDAVATDRDWELLSTADVAIEFTRPESAVENINKCFALKVPIVVGTTGW
jgi:4-hydroxy-tetrahydrodipicolinate reductase